MAYATQTAVSNGSLTTLNVAIEFLYRSEITVYFDDLLQNSGWRWVDSSGSHIILFDTAVPVGTVVKLRRTTNVAEPFHTFSEGAMFDKSNMDDNFKQMLHVAQEVQEGSGTAAATADLDMRNYRITNLAPGVNPLDAVTMQQLDDIVVGASTGTNLPSGGANIYAGNAGDVLQFRQVVAGSNVSVTQTTTGIVISSDAPGGAGEVNTASNIGTGHGLATTKVGTNLPFKTIKAGTGVSVSSTADEVTISSTVSGGTSEVANVVTFGAIGNFIPAAGSTGTGTDNSAAFDSAMASGKPLYIPAGNFYVASWSTRANFLKYNSSGPGRVWASTNVGITQIGKTLSIGTVRSHEVQSVGGILLGGESDGHGMRQWMGHHNWMQWQPTRDGAPNQLQLYSSANTCSASCQAPNILNAVVGTFNISKMEVGDHFGWYGTVYKILGLTSSTQITVSTFAGGSPAFVTDATPRPFYHAYESAEGTCNTSGTSVTYMSGEQYPYGVTGDHMYAIINGTKYTVALGPESLDANHLTLSTSAGTQTNVPLVFRRCYGPWAYVSLLRLQGLSGGVETNCGLYLNIKNEAVLYNGATSDNLAGNMRINAPRIRLGNDDNTEQIEVGIGYTTIGGYPGACSLRVPKVANAVNYIETAGSPTSFASYLAARGQDTNPDMGFDLKGSGVFRWTAGSFARTVFEAYAPSSSSAWPTVAADPTTPIFGVSGPATNIDLKIQPKGTGATVVGSQLVANSGTWGSMSFSLLNGWTDATWGISAKYRLDVGSRVVRLSGQLSGGAYGSKIYVLPVGFRPSRTVMLGTIGSGVTAAAVQVLTDGSIHGFGVGSPVTQLVFDGLTFSID